MKTIVLGGTGWVGHHIAAAFSDAGHDVTICSRGRKTTYAPELPAGAKFVVADKQNAADMVDVFATHFDVVIDSVPTEASIDNVYQAARRLKQYVHCSSTGGYAPLASVPGDETSPYDHFMGGWAQKAIVDAKVMDLFHRQGFPATVIRPSYITGPGLLPLDNFGGRRQDFITDILDNRPLELPNDGQALLHPVQVSDLARSFVLAAETPASIGQIYNICLPRAVPLTRYLEITAAALAREVQISFAPVEALLAKYGDRIDARGLHFLATHMCYDITKARTQLGYAPAYTTAAAIEENAVWAARQLMS